MSLQTVAAELDEQSPLAATLTLPFNPGMTGHYNVFIKLSGLFIAAISIFVHFFIIFSGGGPAVKDDKTASP